MEIIKLKKANKVFPNFCTKIRGHDLIRIMEKQSKNLSIKEFKKLDNFLDEQTELKGDFEFLVCREKNKIKFILFNNET